MTYTYTNAENTLITDGSRFIPVDPANADYQKIVAGNVTIQPYVAPPEPVPDLTVRQLLAALVLNGFITEAEAMDRTTVPTAIAAMFDTLPTSAATVARITWANMTIIPRNDPLVDALGAVLNQTQEQIDDFFRQAALI